MVGRGRGWGALSCTLETPPTPALPTTLRVGGGSRSSARRDLASRFGSDPTSFGSRCITPRGRGRRSGRRTVSPLRGHARSSSCAGAKRGPQDASSVPAQLDERLRAHHVDVGQRAARIGRKAEAQDRADVGLAHVGQHDKYAYEAGQLALHDTDLKYFMAFGVAGLSVAADSLSAIKFAKVSSNKK